MTISGGARPQGTNSYFIFKVNELELAAEKDPNSFWKVLKTVNDDITNDKTTTPISEAQWLSHFTKLHSKHTLNKEQHDMI